MDAIIHAVQLLAGHDDGARTLDTLGFNKVDTDFGQRLAALPAHDWTPKMARQAWEMLHKYRGQLSGYGVDFEAIPEPVKPQPYRVVNTQDGKLVVKFDYDANLLIAFKEAIPPAARRWNDEQKIWLVQAGERDSLLAWAARHSFAIDESVHAAVPVHKMPERYMIRINDWIHIYFPYDRVLVEQVKEIQGAKYKTVDNWKYWAVPFLNELSAQPLLDFAKRFQFDMTMDNGWLLERLKEVAERTKINVAMSLAMDAEIDVPGLRGVAANYQKAAIKYALENERVIIADAPGTGKTFESLATVQAANAYPCLITTLAIMKRTWVREIEQFLPVGKKVYVCAGRKPPADVDLKQYDLVVINHDILTGWVDTFLDVEWQSFILDESTAFKNGKTKRSIAAKQIAWGVVDGETVAQPVRYRLALTGTPVMNRPSELMSQLEILGRLQDFGGFMSFAKKFCAAQKTRFGWDFSGSANLDELNRLMRAQCYVRRLKRDVLTELPDKRRVVLPVELDNRKEYDRAEKDVIKWLKEHKPIPIPPVTGLSLEGVQKLAWKYNTQHTDNDKLAYLRGLDIAKDMSEERFAIFANQFAESITAQARERGREQAAHLVRIEALKQLAAQGKLEAIKEWVASFLETGEKLLLFAYHREIVELLGQTFDAPFITGSTSAQKRQDYVDAFQNDPSAQLLVMNIQAGSMGLTLTAASNVAFVELDWTPSNLEQAESRIERRGQKNAMTAWYLLAENSIDMEIWDLLEQKQKIVDAATEGGQVEDFSIMNELIERMKER